VLLGMYLPIVCIGKKSMWTGLQHHTNRSLVAPPRGEPTTVTVCTI
jgi:hypothetical protein